MNWEFERYKRQLGLVHQRRVMDLNILLLGDGPALPYVATNLALLGVGTLTLPAASSCVTTQQRAGQFLFRAEDEGAPISETLARRVAELNPRIHAEFVEPQHARACDAVVVTSDVAHALPSNIPVIWAGVTDYGMFIGARKPHAAPLAPNLITPALASLCGALAAQEVLRVTRCLRPSEIVKFWVTLNYALREPANAGLVFAVDGAPTASFSDKPDGALPICRVPVNLNNDLVRLLFEQSTLGEPIAEIYDSPTECLYYSPFWGNRLENDGIVEAPIALSAPHAPRVVLGGIGGLGTWVAALLAVSDFTGELVVFDADTQVENHNLNRQVLYDDSAIGAPKVHAAARALRRINPALTVTALLEEIQATTVVTHAELMAHANLAISTFDNFRARYVFSEWAALSFVPLVNGGSDGFNGDVEVIEPAKHGCLLCRWEQARGRTVAQTMSMDEAHLSCTREDANAPEVGAALVTTTAAIASWQTLLALLALAKPAARVDHHLGFLGKENAVEKCRIATPCPVHEKGACEHPQRFWQMLEETIHGDDP
ncbi:MAG: ThiF family adenylyltransferase [Chloroflexi bacterium]|nr:ThiF family adenylyltransferase [Chloroflexota bacterium]